MPAPHAFAESHATRLTTLEPLRVSQGSIRDIPNTVTSAQHSQLRHGVPHAVADPNRCHRPQPHRAWDRSCSKPGSVQRTRRPNDRGVRGPPAPRPNSPSPDYCPELLSAWDRTFATYRAAPHFERSNRARFAKPQPAPKQTTPSTPRPRSGPTHSCQRESADRTDSRRL